ncbi:helix-turn-helix domain-containing protein [Bacillus subtilis]|nr:helix-turn-helix domain-containing protein [Bacillus subtilis]
MAVEMMTWARRQVFPAYDLNGSERFVLFLLADNASWSDEVEQWYAYPLLKTLVRDSGLSQSTVQRALARFEELGLISRQRRYRPSGAPAGNGYFLHTEAVEAPIAKTHETPDKSRVVTMTTPENSRVVTMTSRQNTGRGEPVDNPSDPREFKSGHHDQSHAGVVTMTTGSGHHDQSHARYSSARPSLTINEPSSSSMSPSARDEDLAPAGAGETTTKNESDPKEHTPESHPVRFGTCRVSNARGDVDLDKLVTVVAGHWTVTLDRDRAVWLAEAIIGRSARTVGSPDAFVRRSLVNDGHEWQEAVMDHFGADMTGDRSSGHDRADDRKCPIPHHADSGWKAHNCPGCRKQLDFPKMLDRSIYEALDPDVRDLIDRDQTVTIIDVPVNRDRTRSPIGRSSDRSIG